MIMAGNRTQHLKWIIAILALLPYAIYQSGYVINSDNALMIEYARRWLSGGIYGVDVYDPNPPANFILYIPVVYLAKIMPVWHALTAYVSVLLLLSALSVRSLLRNCAIDKPSQDIVLFAYIFGNIFLANVFYGERDQLILLALFPFVLLQYGLLGRVPLRTPVQWGVLVAGALCAFVKPHYGLMPVLMILYRAWHQKSLKVLLDPDVLALTAGFCVHAVLLWQLFPVYLHDTLPQAIRIYAPDMDVGRLAASGLVLFVGGLLWAFYATCKTEKAASRLTLWLMVFAACLFVAGFSQMKGYYYHAVPQFIVLYVAASFITYQLIKIRTGQGALALTLAVCISLAYIFMPPSRSYLTHDEFKSLNISSLYQGCQAPCPVFVFDKYPDIAILASVYNDGIFASRFPSYWFLPEIVGPGNPPGKESYLRMVAGDVIRYKPAIIALVRTDVTDASGRKVAFDFVKFFSENPEFDAAMQTYEKSAVFTLRRYDYHRGTTLDDKTLDVFDVYRLKTLP